MAAKDNNAIIEDLLEKVNSIAEELASIKEELSALSTLSDIAKTVESMDSDLSELKESKDLKELNKKIDKMSDTVNGFEESVKDMADAKETEVIIKKIDDILLSLTETDVVAKKLDDLQGYIAGLSSIEEKVQDLSNQFDETNEIVGIIVRQLDDIERKYNQSIDKISDTAEMVTKIMESASLIDASSDRKLLGKKPTKTTDDDDDEIEKAPPISKVNLPSTIDALMNRLIGLVNPQTEATEMAEALEDVRDQLTTIIKGHTPVLFQFGKRARELKSYPPTATLNENDIATLNKEIKSWSSKLKEIAKSS
ncbi:hypothetical protein EU527_14025 [Candidatus Thorarchaeota archaeon]|nr:MAG: hypothetical protein EU527_14025 [Candidatus Thorarchaeota archaeon]